MPGESEPSPSAEDDIQLTLEMRALAELLLDIYELTDTETLDGGASGHADIDAVRSSRTMKVKVDQKPKL